MTVREQLAEELARSKVRAAQNQRNAEVLIAGLALEEKQILRMTASGLGSHEMARVLGINQIEFQTRMRELLAKMRINTTSDAVRIAIYAGLESHDLT